jgi:hypothetical protein
MMNIPRKAIDHVLPLGLKFALGSLAGSPPESISQDTHPRAFCGGRSLLRTGRVTAPTTEAAQVFALLGHELVVSIRALMARRTRKRAPLLPAVVADAFIAGRVARPNR